MYFIKKFLFRSTSTGTAANQTDTEIPSNSHSSTACATASDGTFSTAPSTSSISTVASVDIRRIEDIFAAHEAALATGQDIHVRVTFDENGEMVVANMEPLHDFNPCQELSPPLKQEGFLPTDWEERPTTDKPRKKEKGKHDYDRRLRNAVKFVRRAALVGVERPESAASAETVLSVGGRTLAWAVSAFSLSWRSTTMITRISRCPLDRMRGSTARS
ncbi:uncharacterized protein C8Q71DRAFT_317914 [Rhodofomes roseus]|uniref:Uncharacterized protein n=1 Tax=Rhodofomes roseus TaxID=34475 RepID=A0ABQ8K2N2_9APHY|nr:uncharacterized protein C8Q71DRAFT_317914 [Rhodofomes roseus]KAH9831009.1 hypothetical protein C8Q71DRAFT_317914 [Rhodofomes roseus]